MKEAHSEIWTEKCPEKNCERSVCSSGLQETQGRTGLLFMGVICFYVMVDSKTPVHAIKFDCIFWLERFLLNSQ